MMTSIKNGQALSLVHSLFRNLLSKLIKTPAAQTERAVLVLLMQ